MLPGKTYFKKGHNSVKFLQTISKSILTCILPCLPFCNGINASIMETKCDTTDDDDDTYIDDADDAGEDMVPMCLLCFTGDTKREKLIRIL